MYYLSVCQVASSHISPLKLCKYFSAALWALQERTVCLMRVCVCVPACEATLDSCLGLRILPGLWTKRLKCVYE